MKLLLISNSTCAHQSYLEFAKTEIANFVGKGTKNILFIPFAAVRFSYDEYVKKVNDALAPVGLTVTGIHQFSDHIQAIKDAEAIIVGGGNTWKLLKTIQDNKLLQPIKEKILNGTPYIGWSAGSNIACPTIRTTNDMPIVEPKSFEAFNFVPFQINPHYEDTSMHAKDLCNETREDRINEYLIMNPGIYVAGLREGSSLKIENDKIELIGNKTVRIFVDGSEPKELSSESDFTFLLKNPIDK